MEYRDITGTELHEGGLCVIGKVTYTPGSSPGSVDRKGRRTGGVARLQEHIRIYERTVRKVKGHQEVRESSGDQARLSVDIECTANISQSGLFVQPLITVTVLKGIYRQAHI